MPKKAIIVLVLSWGIAILAIGRWWGAQRAYDYADRALAIIDLQTEKITVLSLETQALRDYAKQLDKPEDGWLFDEWTQRPNHWIWVNQQEKRVQLENGLWVTVRWGGHQRNLDYPGLSIRSATGETR